MKTIKNNEFQAKNREVEQNSLLEICKSYILSVEDRKTLSFLQKQIQEKKAELV
ncbi:hypothetical protein [Enterococcus sp.]|jgi:hypothetical protein|uniref:hypothetical protein n=1 Tax=Enterococcus sp. TaxID=35783 RepID=UPI0025C53E64|nr:hypothetical protein [Enterococcus sp.]